MTNKTSFFLLLVKIYNYGSNKGDFNTNFKNNCSRNS